MTHPARWSATLKVGLAIISIEEIEAAAQRSDKSTAVLLHEMYKQATRRDEVLG